MKYILFFFLFICALQLKSQTVTELFHSGNTGSKQNIVVIGDGFTANGQQTYNTFVDQIIDQLFSDGVFRETMNAFNVYRINVNSKDSGVTQVDSNGTVTTARNTALDMRYSGNWNRCWMEEGSGTTGQIDALIAALAPQQDFIFIIMNEGGGGGCRRGNRLAITSGESWTTAAHEMGHMIGNLGDEYFGATGCFNGSEPDAANLTRDRKREDIKWKDFINPNTPITTITGTMGINGNQDAGLYAGAVMDNTTFSDCIFRPVDTCRMRSNAPPFCPVCYNKIQENTDGDRDNSFSKSYTGDFNGDGRTDLVLHNENNLLLYLSRGDRLEIAWSALRGIDPIWDSFRSGDIFYVGDYNGDGKDDLMVTNMIDWNTPYLGILKSTGMGFTGICRFDGQLPGWGEMRIHDQFLVGDFNGDRKADVYVYNLLDWSMPYLELLKSTGNNLVYSHRFDRELPGWGDMKLHDTFYLGDFNADLKKDLAVFNGVDWQIAYLEILRADGNSLQYSKRFDRELPGWGEMLQHDQFYVADFNADRKSDLYVFNGRDWNMGYMLMLRSTGTDLQFVKRFDDVIPGWDKMKANDQFFVADVNGDRKQDLYAYNATDWNTQYLGMLQTNGSNLSGNFQDDWIDDWNLGDSDQFQVVNFNGASKWDDLFIRNEGWFGLLRSHQNQVRINAIYPKWIYTHRYHVNGWW